MRAPDRSDETRETRVQHKMSWCGTECERAVTRHLGETLDAVTAPARYQVKAMAGEFPTLLFEIAVKEETTVVAKHLLHTLRTVTVHSHRPADERPCASRRGRP